MNILAIDIGGTSIKYAVFDQHGKMLTEILNKETTKTETDNYILERLYELINETKDAYEIDGITISTAGVVDSQTGTVVYSGPTIPGYSNTPLSDIISDSFNVPCEVENDVNCAALGEYWKGEGVGSQSLALVTIGTGVGGAVIINGQLWNGFNHSAGEIGYIPLEDGSLLQDRASTSALIKKYEESSNSQGINGKMIFEKAKSGEKVAIEAIGSILNTLTQGLLSIIYILAPETVIIGGGIAEQKEYLEERISKNINEKVIAKRFMPKKIKCAHLGNAAGMIGAVYNYLNKHPLSEEENEKRSNININNRNVIL